MNEPVKGREIELHIVGQRELGQGPSLTESSHFYAAELLGQSTSVYSLSLGVTCSVHLLQEWQLLLRTPVC